MNKADGFGWQSSPKRSNFENGDNDSATDSRQELSFWGGLADALRRTANYASSEFERFFGNMGFRSEPYTSHREPLRPTSPEQRVDVGFAESSSLASSLVPNHHRPTKDHSGGGKLWRQSPRSSLFAKRDPRRRSHSGRLREIQQLSKMLNTLKDEAEQAERDIRAQSFSRSQTSFETADTFSEESANLKPAHTDAQDTSSQSLHMPTPLIHENNMQIDDSAASVKHKNLDEGHDERVARLEKQIMHLQKEVAAYRESIKSLTSSAKAAAESVATSPARSRPPLPPSFDTSHIRASATPRESPLPSPPAISPNRVSLPNRSPRPNRITKPTASPIRAHNLQGAVRVLPPSSFVRDAYRSQTNRAAPDDKHIGAMRAIVRQIPHVKLRRTEHVLGPDGSLHTNPFWIEIYDPDRNYRQKRSRYRNTEETDSMTEQESPVKRQKTTWY